MGAAMQDIFNGRSSLGEVYATCARYNAGQLQAGDDSAADSDEGEMLMLSEVEDMAAEALTDDEVVDRWSTLVRHADGFDRYTPQNAQVQLPPCCLYTSLCLLTGN